MNDTHSSRLFLASLSLSLPLFLSLSFIHTRTPTHTHTYTDRNRRTHLSAYSLNPFKRHVLTVEIKEPLNRIMKTHHIAVSMPTMFDHKTEIITMQRGKERTKRKKEKEKLKKKIKKNVETFKCELKNLNLATLKRFHISAYQSTTAREEGKKKKKERK